MRLLHWPPQYWTLIDFEFRACCTRCLGCTHSIGSIRFRLVMALPQVRCGVQAEPSLPPTSRRWPSSGKNFVYRWCLHRLLGACARLQISRRRRLPGRLRSPAQRRLPRHAQLLRLILVLVKILRERLQDPCLPFREVNVGQLGNPPLRALLLWIIWLTKPLLAGSPSVFRRLIRVSICCSGSARRCGCHAHRLAWS
jgi:hypothetical protein